MNKHVTNELRSCKINLADGDYSIKDLLNDKEYLTETKVRIRSGIIDLDSLDEACGELINVGSRSGGGWLTEINFVNGYFEVFIES